MLLVTGIRGTPASNYVYGYTFMNKLIGTSSIRQLSSTMIVARIDGSVAVDVILCLQLIFIIDNHSDKFITWNL